MRTVHCNCGNEIEADIPETYDVEKNPGLLEGIVRGDFLTLRCDQCGTLLKLELPVRITSSSHDMDLYYLPDSKREQFLGDTEDFPEAKRIVFGYPELVEKALTALHGLDDRVIEILKYFYLRKNPNAENITIYLDEVQETSLLFRIHGLKKDEVGIAKIDRAFYNKIGEELDAIVEKEDLTEVIEPPYVSIKKVVVEVEE